MDCRRAEELLSDHYEGSLDAVLEADLTAHLGSCPDCRALREALAQVIEALQSPVPEPPAALAERAATAALRRPRPATGGTWPAWVTPERFLPLAAGLALAIGGGVFLARSAGFDPGRSGRRLVERSANAAAYLVERKDRLVEDVRLLRVVISTAFEGRLDRVNDRVDDYRKLLEKRRNAGQEQPKKKNGAGAAASTPDWALNFHGTFSLRTCAAKDSYRGVWIRHFDARSDS